jgi:predicted CXXCH cytochrome family protein
MFKRLIVFSVVIGVLGVALAVGVSYAGPGDIYGSAHDLGSPGNPTCQQCHVPHDAQGDYLWARPPRTDLPASEALCFSCHDGTVTGRGSYIITLGTTNHPMGPETHLTSYGDEGYCLACHDAHDGDFMFTKDLMRDGKPPNPDNAQVCLACHGGTHFNPDPAVNHPWVTAGMTPPNLPLDMTFNPGAGDSEGTRLYDAATLKEVVAPGEAGNIGCLTCHSPHGAADPVMITSMSLYDALGREALCGNCHP